MPRLQSGAGRPLYTELKMRSAEDFTYEIYIANR